MNIEQSKPTATFEEVSPETASDWLKCNVRNRPLSRAEMNRIRSAMDGGRWVVNGDAIRFDKDGILIDGQKRLTAISLGDKTYSMLVVRGLPPMAFETIDQQQRRTAGHVLAISKVPNASVVAAAAALALAYERYGDPFASRGGTRSDIVTISRFVDSNPEIIECASLTSGNKWVRKYMRGSISSFLMFHWWRRRDELSRMFDRLNTGEGLSINSPVLHFRNRLVDIATTAGTTPDPQMICALSQKAIIAYMDRKPLKILRIRTNGASEDISSLYKRNALMRQVNITGEGA